MSAQLTPERSTNPDTGWGYMDQMLPCPNLHGPIKLRSSIFKRPLLTTIFNRTDPVRGRHMTYSMVRYAHEACPPVSARLALQAGLDTAAIIRGVEDRVIPSLKLPARVFCYHGAGKIFPLDHDPRSIGIDQMIRAVSLSEDTPMAGTQDDAIATTVDIDAADTVRKVIDSGEALSRFGAAS